MVSSARSQSRGSLSTTAPTAGERSLAASVMLVSAAALLGLAPFAETQLPRVPSLIAAYEGALFICDLVTAALIAWQATQVRSKALVVLTAGYVFDAAMLVPHILTFPGVFSPAGLLGGRTQTTAWIYMFWHGGFPLLVIAYAMLDSRTGGERAEGSLLRPLVFATAGAIGAAVVLTLVATLGEAQLTVLVNEGSYRPAVRHGVSQAVWLLSFIALLTLEPWRPRSVLNLWLGVVMFAWLLDIAASAIIGAARFDVGFYAGRLYGLLAATFVLITLLLELGRLYQRLASVVEVEERAGVLARIVEAQEHERQRIARELHDEMGTYLSGMTISLGLLAQKHGGDAVKDLQRLLAQADRACDTLAQELRPPTLDDLGVDRAIGQLADRFTAATGIPVHLHQRAGGERLPGAVETTLYRVVQEALTNVSKHSHAKMVSVILDRREEEVQLIVEDNGCGFDPAAARAGSPHFGLLGMEERIRLVEGTLAIESAPGSGTSLYVRVPLAAAAGATP